MRELYESVRLRAELGTALSTIGRSARRLVDAMDRISPTYVHPDYDAMKKYVDAVKKMAWEQEVEDAKNGTPRRI